MSAAGAPVPLGRLLAYGALSAPLAFAALPVYVHVPRLYGTQAGLSLGVVGGVLLLARLLDALSDPVLGYWSDRLRQRRRLTLLALPLLAVGMLGLLRPPDDAGAGWLAVCLALAYSGYSLASVNYCAWGAEAGADALQRTRFTAAREGCALIGVLFAAALPDWIAADFRAGLASLALVFLPLLLVMAVLTGRYAPAPAIAPPARGAQRSALRDVLQPLSDGRFLRLLAVFAANGIASAIPATLVLFFVADVLQAERLAGVFLLVYFAAAACGLPLWLAIARRIGKLRAWMLSMGIAILVFAFAASLGEGDLVRFGLICLVSGFALGADLAFPPALLADALAEPVRAHAGATYFGWWNLATKLNLALAAGIALPLLDWLGYRSGLRSDPALFALAAVYALLPVVLKLLAAVLLWRLRAAIEGASR